jgi:hypothetical protein
VTLALIPAFSPGGEGETHAASLEIPAAGLAGRIAEKTETRESSSFS